jgi:hypothetical protein
MIRHIYDLPYAQEDTHTDKESLVFCMNVFVLADKYDVASLRRKVVSDFELQLKSTWQSEEFVECVEKLCGPDAICLADPALQVAVTSFFTNNMSKLAYHESLVEMIREDKSFTGRILAGLLETLSGSTRYLGVCYKPNGSIRAKSDCTQKTEEHSDYLAAARDHCVHCGETGGEVYNMSGGGTGKSSISNMIKVVCKRSPR